MILLERVAVGLLQRRQHLGHAHCSKKEKQQKAHGVPFVKGQFIRSARTAGFVPIAVMKRHGHLAGRNVADACRHLDATAPRFHHHGVALAYAEARGVRVGHLHIGVGRGRPQRRRAAGLGARVDVIVYLSCRGRGGGGGGGGGGRRRGGGGARRGAAGRRRGLV